MRIICIGIALFLCVFAGCASIPATVAMAQIDDVIQSDMLTDAHEVTPADKARLKMILARSRAEIGDAETARQAAVKSAEKDRIWASRGKWGAGILIGIVVLCVVGAGLKFLGKLPIL